MDYKFIITLHERGVGERGITGHRDSNAEGSVMSSDHHVAPIRLLPCGKRSGLEFVIWYNRCMYNPTWHIDIYKTYSSKGFNIAITQYS